MMRCIAAPATPIRAASASLPPFLEFLIQKWGQAEMSWNTTLHKRVNYRVAFCDFDAARIARYYANKIELLKRDTCFVRTA